MVKVIAVINQKGGVGKTTTSINLAHALALSGQRVLAVDLDPQGHLSVGLGISDRNMPGMDEILLNGNQLDEYIVSTRSNLDMVPAGPGLANMEHVTEGGIERGLRLKSALKPVASHYDSIIFDCPPSAGLLGMNALFAASELIIPVSSDYLALQSLSSFMVTLQFAEKTCKRRMRKHVLMTRYHAQRRLAREVRESLQTHFPEQLMKTSIRETVALAESPSYGETIFEYKDVSNGADDYRQMATELTTERWH
jgi:chromosome partitioning protein